MRLSFAFALLLGFQSALAQVPAFPGAEGFGKFATGGRGGKVLRVVNLHDDGPGSLRDAIQKKGPRIIIFDVSGTIELQSPLDINNGDVTIAGQSAPGDGICLRNYTLSVKDDNVIIRFLRFRMGDTAGFEGDAISGNRGKNIIVDHCSISWATDECASFYNNDNFTLQWCIISESLNKSVHSKGQHGYGGIWGGRNASFHHNLIANHTSRLPRFSGSASTPNTPDELVDFRNNVIYNWRNNNIYGGEKGRYNVVDNYLKPGPATRSQRNRHIIDPWKPYGRFYLAGNVVHNAPEVSDDNRKGVLKSDPDSVLVNEPFPAMYATPRDASTSYQRVLDLAGASLVRDQVDRRIVDEVRSGRSSSGAKGDGIIDSQNDVGGWPLLESQKAPADQDGDGMPDKWERRNGLDQRNPADAIGHQLNPDYDNVEVYLNSLVDPVVRRQ